jgi:hypothetical protein
MKNLIRHAIGAAALAAMITVTAHASEKTAGIVDFGKFTPSGSGGQFVEVNITSNLIAMISRLTKTSEPEIANLIEGIKTIRVNVIGLTDDNREEIQERMKGIRTQLDTQGWERLVTVQQQQQDVGVHLKLRGQEAVEGLVVTVMQGTKEAVFINIVGNIQPENLAIIGERFNIDPLKKLGPVNGKKPAPKT